MVAAMPMDDLEVQFLQSLQPLPEVSIRVYNTSGLLAGELVYTQEKVTFVPHPIRKATETTTVPPSPHRTENATIPPACSL